MAAPDPSATRAHVLAAVLQAAAGVPGPVIPGALLQAAMASLALPEEECADDAYKAMALLTRSGLLVCNTHGTLSGSTTISSDTVFTPSQALIDFMWSED